MSQLPTGHPDEPIAAALVNTHDVTLAQPEKLTGPDELARFMREHGVRAKRRVRAGDVARARELRAQVRAVFEAADEPAAVRLVNDLLGQVPLTAALEPTDGGWALTERATQSDPATALTSAVALDLARLLARGGYSQAKVCGAAPCRDAFVDRTRNRSRRFCSIRCATRDRVAAHRRKVAARGTRAVGGERGG
jgi:predicted RNA-binding Zn ribbon-like protein